MKNYKIIGWIKEIQNQPNENSAKGYTIPGCFFIIWMSES